MPVVSVSAATDAAPRPPNILFFFADDQRHDTHGTAGHPIVQTPTIDRLAQDGVRFRNAFVTTPVCWVGRSSHSTNAAPGNLPPPKKAARKKI